MEPRAKSGSSNFELNHLGEVLTLNGVGIWTWDLNTDAVLWILPRADGSEGTELVFQSSSEFVKVACGHDRESLAGALRLVAEGQPQLRHTFSLEGATPRVIRIEAKRFDDTETSRVLGISHDDTERADVESRLTTLFDERDRVARVLETMLLPPSLPAVPGMSIDAAYQSCEGEATGDFYDLFPLGSGDWALTIGDVGGHGPTAAAITTSVRYSLRAAALVRRNPSRVLEAANESHMEAVQDDRFTTCHFVRIQRKGDEVLLRVATAGHPDLVIKRADGRIECVCGSGPMLGLMRSPKFVDTRVVLRSGDVLVAYTDGVIEARRSGELFGTEGVSGFLSDWHGPINGLAKALHARADAFNDGQASDDMATVVIQVDGDTPLS